MYNYKLIIAYDGTLFSGWQIQPNSITIQEKLEKIICIIIKENISLIGSGRTDAGVHALGQTANFKCQNPLQIPKFLKSLNGMLPLEIRIIRVEEVSLDFHSRYSAIGKCYHYHLCLDPVQLPFSKNYSWHIFQKFDVELLKKAAKLFIGKHDFTSFANESHKGSASKNPVRNLYRLDVIEEAGGVRLEFEGDGFLYKMVRNIVGVLHEVSIGKRDISQINEIFASKDRRKAGKSAPPHGLFLVEVFYPKE